MKDNVEQQRTEQVQPELKTPDGADCMFETLSLPPAPNGGSITSPAGERLHFGRYVVRAILGEGGFGRVYLARDQELDRDVAVKVPRHERTDGGDTIETWMSEARTVAKVRHPGIVSIFDVGMTAAGIPYVVMEYIDGPSLRARLKSGTLNATEAATTVAAIADAIAAANKVGVIHRDLKPDNVLFDGRGTARVTDFGLAINEQAQRVRAGEYAGTAAYMSPEQVRGEVHRLDGRSDVWSLGVILYQLLTNKLPFGGDSVAQLFDEIEHRDPKPLRQHDERIPARLERVFRKCCAKAVSDRYSTASELAHELRTYLDSADPTLRIQKPQHRNLLAMRLSFGRMGCLLSVTLSVLVMLGAYYRTLIATPHQVIVRASENELDDAKVIVDGRVVAVSGSGELLQPLSLGKHHIAIERPGFVPLEYDIVVKAGGPHEIVPIWMAIELRKDSPKIASAEIIAPQGFFEEGEASRAIEVRGAADAGTALTAPPPGFEGWHTNVQAAAAQAAIEFRDWGVLMMPPSPILLDDLNRLVQVTHEPAANESLGEMVLAVIDDEHAYSSAANEEWAFDSAPFEPVFVVADHEGRPFFIVRDWDSIAASFHSQRAAWDSQHEMLKQLIAAVEMGSSADRVRAANSAISWLYENGLWVFYGPEIRRWHSAARDFDRDNRQSQLEQLFELDWRLRMRGTKHDVEVINLVRELGHWPQDRFNDPNRGARLHLIATKRLVEIGELDEARSHLRIASGFSPIDDRIRQSTSDMNRLLER